MYKEQDDDMLEKIKALAERVAEYLGVEIIPIEFDNIVDDSRLVLRPEVKIVINSKYQDDYFECAKAVTHEYRHLFQIFYANMFNDSRANVNVKLTTLSDLKLTT